MKKVYVTRNSNTQSGAQMKIVDTDTNAIELFDVKLEPDGKAWRLPDNPAGRKWVFVSKLKDVDEIEVLPKAKATGTPAVHTPRTPLEDFLEGDEREMYIQLRDKAIAAAQAKAEADKAKKKADAEIERKRAAYEKAKAEYEALMKGSN